MKLYSFALSPYARFAETVALMAGIPVEVVEINLLKGEHRAEWFIKLNPKHQVPTLEVAGHGLSESCAIAKYFCASVGYNDFYPADAYHRAQIDEIIKEMNDERYGLSVKMRYFPFTRLFGQPETLTGVQEFEEAVEKIISRR